MKISAFYVQVWLISHVVAQSGDPLLSIIISDAVSVFTSVTSYVGSQLSSATKSNDAASTTSASSSTATSISITSSATSTYSKSSSISASSAIVKASSTTPTNAAASSSAQPTGSSTSSSKDHGQTLPIILGTVLGILALGFLILLLVVLCCRKKHRAAGNIRCSSFSSSSSDTIYHEKRSRFNGPWTSQTRSKRSPKGYNPATVSPKHHNNFPGIPPAHGILEDAYIPTTSTNPQDRRAMAAENHYGALDEGHPFGHDQDQQPNTTMIMSVPLSDAAAEYYDTRVRDHARRYPSTEYHDTTDLPPRPPTSRSMDFARSKKRSLIASRWSYTTSPHRMHDSMSEPTSNMGITSNTVRDPAPAIRRHSDHSRRDERVLTNTGQELHVGKGVSPDAVYELSDTSQDTELDHLRRTGTLTRSSISSARDLAGCHELSAPVLTSKEPFPTALQSKTDHANTQRVGQQPLSPQPPSRISQSLETGGDAHLSASTVEVKSPKRRSKQNAVDRREYEQYNSNPWSPDDVGRTRQSAQSAHQFWSPGTAPAFSMPSTKTRTPDPRQSEHHSTDENTKSRPVFTTSPNFDLEPESVSNTTSKALAEQSKPNDRIARKPIAALSNSSQPLRSNSNYVPTNHHATFEPEIHSTNMEDFGRGHLDISDVGLNGRWNSRGRWKKDGDEGQWISRHSQYAMVGQAM